MRFWKKLADFVPMIITLLVIVILGMMMFVVLRVQNGFADIELWLNTGFGFVLQLIMIFVWIPEGKQKGKKDESYLAAMQDANTRMATASTNENFAPLEAFCAFATEENVHVYIAQRVGKFGVNYEMWLQNTEYRQSFGDKIQRKVDKLEKVARRKVKQIKATEITTVAQIKNKYDVDNHTKLSERVRISLKLVWSVFSAVIGAFISSDGAVISWNSAIKFVYWCIVILMTIFFAIRTGTELITVEEKGYLVRVIDFLKRFEAWKETKFTSCEK